MPTLHRPQAHDAGEAGGSRLPSALPLKAPLKWVSLSSVDLGPKAGEGLPLGSLDKKVPGQGLP